MPRLPAFDPSKRVCHSPHVVILGAGASLAAFPSGDATGKRLPLLGELPECLGLTSAIKSAGFSATEDFESVYDKVATSGSFPSLKVDIELRVRSYFEALAIPATPTLYDYLLLSLRKCDLIATFNWDPLLAQAFMRNRGASDLPQIAFLHGNVQVGACIKDRVKGFRGDTCQKCGQPLNPAPLLYPVRNKDYKSDPFISNEWSVLEQFLQAAYMVTVFGYSAPTTDAAAVDLMKRTWAGNPTFELGQVTVVDVKSEDQLKATWEPFFCRSHFGIHRTLSTTWILRHPRRSCEALAMATLQNDPWPDNPFPEFHALTDLHAWVSPLVAEEKRGHFSGKPCPKAEHAIQTEPARSVPTGIDWVLDWLKTMCKGEIIPPLCVELTLTGGAKYYLHSIVSFDDETQTLCARIWDLRAFEPAEIDGLKQKLNHIRLRTNLAPAEAVHPKLDWANLHIHYKDIAYCVEWHDRIWPNKSRKKPRRRRQP